MMVGSVLDAVHARANGGRPIGKRRMFVMGSVLISILKAIEERHLSCQVKMPEDCAIIDYEALELRCA